MSDRLEELLRQRAAIQAHLAWLDREIAETAERLSPSIPPPAAPAKIVSSTKPEPKPEEEPSVAESNAQAERIMADYKQDVGRQQSDIKRGCFLYLASAFAVLAIFLLLFYFFHTRRQPIEHEPQTHPSGEKV